MVRSLAIHSLNWTLMYTMKDTSTHNIINFMIKFMLIYIIFFKILKYLLTIDFKIKHGYLI